MLNLGSTVARLKLKEHDEKLYGWWIMLFNSNAHANLTKVNINLYGSLFVDYIFIIIMVLHGCCQFML